MGLGLFADVKLRGVEVAQQALKTFNTSLGESEDRLKRQKTQSEMTAASLLKVWAAYQYVTGASSVAGAVMDAFTASFGYLIDVILLPFLPLLLAVVDLLFRFSSWFSEQGPIVRAALLIIGGAFLIAFGGPTAVAIGIVLLLLGLLYAWSSGPASAIVAAIAAVGAAFVILGGETAIAALAFLGLDAAAAPWIALGLIIVAVIFAIRAAWLALKGEESFHLPSLNEVKQQLGIGDIPSPSSVGANLPAIPAPTGGMPYGPGGSVTNNTQNWNINVNALGGSKGGRDAGIATSSYLSARSRMV